MCVGQDMQGSTRTSAREVDIPEPTVHDGRRLEVVVVGLPLRGGAQLAIHTTMVCAMRRDGALALGCNVRVRCSEGSGVFLGFAPQPWGVRTRGGGPPVQCACRVSEQGAKRKDRISGALSLRCQKKHHPKKRNKILGET